MRSDYANWNPDITKFLGVYGSVDNAAIVYMEDNHISFARHATDSMAGGWNVVRFNLIDNEYPDDYPSIGHHGSSRGMEAYNNTIVY